MSGYPSGTVTFLFTDIEGSTRLWERHPQAMQQALARHDQLLRDAIQAHGGYLFKTVGDAFCAAFLTASDALTAALEAQQRLQAEPWGETGPLRVRMALHVGAAQERDGDYFGAPLNRVARLLAAGHGGQVLLSRAAQELVRDQLPPGLALRDLGERRLKDLFRPEHVFQLVAPLLPSEFPPLKTLDARQSNLPPQPTPLVGREQEVAAVAALLRQGAVRLVTLTGPGGTGKTRLSLQVGADLLDEFEHGVFFVALAPIFDPTQVAPAIAQALGVREEAGQSVTEALHAFLRERQLLLLLDNFEQVVAAAPAVAALLAHAPRLKVLVTSREALHLRGEREIAVPPLALPDLRRLPPPARLSQYEAVRLFIERARDVRPDFAVTNANAPAVAEICARLDGLPLAIELAAARLKLFSPEALLARLAAGERQTHALPLLTGGARDLPARQRTLQAAIAWSYDLLEPEEQRLFRWLAVFVGGSAIPHVEALGQAAGADALALLDGLASLVDKSLLRQEAGPDGESRVGMLQTIGEYAHEQLARSGEAERLQRLHAAHFLAWVEGLVPELRGPQQAWWLDRLEAEHDNLRAALHRLTRWSEWEQGLRLAGALWWFWYVRGHLSEGLHWLENFLAHGAEASEPVRAQALHGAGGLAYGRGAYEAAQRFYEESLALRRAQGDGARVAALLNNLGLLAHRQGRLDQARALYEESLALYRARGEQWGAADLLRNLGEIACDQGDYGAAERYCEEGLAVFRALGEPRGIATALGNLGAIACCRGDDAAARALLEASLAQYEAVGHKQGIANALHDLGWVAYHEGELERARTLFQQSLALIHEVGDRRRVGRCLHALALLALDAGHPEGGALLLGAVSALPHPLESIARAGGRFDEAVRVAGARRTLGEARFATLWAEGHRMSLDEAVAYALREQAP